MFWLAVIAAVFFGGIALLVAAFFIGFWIFLAVERYKRARERRLWGPIWDGATAVGDAVSSGAVSPRIVFTALSSSDSDERMFGLNLMNTNFGPITEKIWHSIRRGTTSESDFAALLRSSDEDTVHVVVTMLKVIAFAHRRKFLRYLPGIPAALASVIESGEPWMKDRCFDVLLKLGKVPEEAHEPILENGIWYTRLNLVEYLVTRRIDAYGTLARAARSDEDWRVRECAIKGLRRYGSAAIRALAPLVHDKHWWNRSCAVEVLSKLGTESIPVLRAFTLDEHPSVAADAEEAIWNLNNSVASRLGRAVAAGVENVIEECCAFVGISRRSWEKADRRVLVSMFWRELRLAHG